MSFKSSSNRLKVEKLYIFGAGASFAASLGHKNNVTNFTSPLDKDFCNYLLDLKEVQRPSWVSSTIERITRNWKVHKDFNSFGLEEAIIVKLGHLDFLNSIHKRKATDYTQEDFLNDISHSICYGLNRNKEYKKTEFYKKIMDEFFSKESKVLENKNRIITFNYDTMLDEHFLKKVKPQRLYFDRILDSREENEGKRRTIVQKDPLILKLHGSNNWACTTQDFKKIITESVKTEELSRLDKIWIRKKTPAPDDDVSPCIIPPLPNKPITQISLFNYLWTRAYEYLHEAEELIICGYSLPQTDNLATALFSNFQNSRVKKIKIIDPDPVILRKWKGLLTRKNINKASWEYYTDFEEYFS